MLGLWGWSYDSISHFSRLFRNYYVFAAFWQAQPIHQYALFLFSLYLYDSFLHSGCRPALYLDEESTRS